MQVRHRWAAIALSGSFAVLATGCGHGPALVHAHFGSSVTSGSVTTTTQTAGPQPSTTQEVPPTAPPSTGGTAPPPCQDGQVVLFTNDSDSACLLSGYPGVAGLDADGHLVTQAIRTPSGYMGGIVSGPTTPPIVSLAPGQTASAIVEGTDNPLGTETSCPHYPFLLVTPPNLTEQVQVTVSGLGSSPPGLPGCSNIEVHPVVPGSTGTRE
jgi:Protein of unknown function (DUF4232)